jgi:hypothetical protein
MWSARTEELAKGRAVRVAVERAAAAVPYSDVIRLWQHDAGFRTFFLGLLADAPYPAFRWETPPVSAAAAGRPFEFVLLDSPGLAATADAEAFAEHFRSAAAEGGVVEFANLGGDAVLVVPCPVGPHSAYGHVAAFVRHAPDEQKHAL